MDTVVWIVLFALSELEQHIIFVSSNPKITVICFSSWLLCFKKKDSIVCCLLFILETVHMRRNLSAATPIHSRPCTQADFPLWLSTKKCSCFEVRKVHITATCLCFFFHVLAFIYLFPQKDHTAITLVKQNCLLIKIIWNTKKYLAQMLKVAGDLRQPPAKFENPEAYLTSIMDIT